MAAHAGSEGIVKIGDHQIAEVKSWSLEEQCDTVDASIIGTKWRKNLATINSWSGSIEAFWDETDAQGQGAFKLGATLELKLYPEGVGNDKHCFTGTAIVSSISRQGSFDGLVESSFSFQGNGELAKIKQQEGQ
jgi:predicted secreted protein